MNIQKLVFLVFSFFLVITCLYSKNDRKVITFETLLKEMSDRTSLAEWPVPNYTTKQASSYSRDSKDSNTSAKDAAFKPKRGRDWGKGWFENHDFSHYIRTEENQGRQEDVMFEDKGAGAIVRFWATFGGVTVKHGGIYRVYIDGKPNPVIEIHTKNFVGKSGIIGNPFSFFAPEKSEQPHWKGRNLYLPIPYAKSCKVTFDEIYRNVKMKGWRGHYYQINYRTYEAGTKVKSFNKKTINKYKEQINIYGEKLIAKDIKQTGKRVLKKNKTLQTGEKLSIELEGEKAINFLQTKLEADNQEQALRSTVLRITFDDKTTVWCPVGQFYGVGYKNKLKHKTYYISATESGDMYSFWVMPFQKKAAIELINYGEQSITLRNFSIGHEAYNWTENSMYFHATWKETRALDTKLRLDYNYVSIEGKGVFVGDNLTIFNTFPDTTGKNWWGEGDEKIYVDKETFPSHFGTGTEDYYNYAWCRPQWFTNPWGSQPIGEGNKTPGNTSNNRYRLLDAIPFTKNFKFDMEIWHPYKSKMNYSPATFFYAFTDAKWNIKPDKEGVKKQVSLKIADVK